MEDDVPCYSKIKEDLITLFNHKFHHNCLLLAFINNQYSGSKRRECPLEKK